MDHFAKPDDELSSPSKASSAQLPRLFDLRGLRLVAIGVSSIGKIGSTYSQNERDIDAYYAAIDEGRLPIMRGYQLNQDDILRRNIIQDLMCRFALDCGLRKYVRHPVRPLLQRRTGEFGKTRRFGISRA